MRIILAIAAAIIVASCASPKDDYWGRLAQGVGDVIERR